MAGTFELFVDAESHFRFRLKAPDGTVMAVSAAFSDKAAAVAGISAVRECAGMGLIADLCLAPDVQNVIREPAPEVNALTVRHDWHKRADTVHTRGKSLRRAAIAPRWAGTA